jgi:peptidoglycan/xylan/chitin deacetylase (PgdA/CDA1 family)
VTARAAWLDRRRRFVLVLAYHGITDLRRNASLQRYAIPPADFAGQLDLIASMGYTFVDLDAVLAGLEGRAPFPVRGVLATFDDCYVDLRDCASPLLSERGIPAVAFAVAGRLGATTSWLSREDGEEVPLLDETDLRALDAASLEVGAHSLTHPVLTDLDDRDLLAEVRGSMDRLVAAGLRPRAFAYPFGRCDGRVAEAVREAGFALGFTTRSGVVTSASDRFRLPRVDLRRGDNGMRLRLRLAAARVRR